MKAIRYHKYGDPSVLRYEDAERPEPAQGEVLVEVAATSFNPVDAGQLRVEVSVTYPLSQASSVHGLSAAGRIRGKVLLTPAS
jgi:NADPH:quinone reductase-like Zn-dependent oxidoreductase